MDDQLVAEVENLVRRWLDDAAGRPVAPAARRLADVLRDPSGLPFTVGFVDRVIRPDDHRVAAANLRELAQGAPGFLPWHLRLLIKLGAVASLVAPGVVIPIAQRALREMVGHLLVDATDARLGRSIARIRERGVRLNINLLGEAVLGRREAERRLTGTEKLLARPDVDYVSIKVSATVPPHSPWAFDEAVDHIEASLLPLFTQAATSSNGKFINLDMEEYRDLELTLAVFTRLLDRPELLGLEAGIVLQAYLPDALSAMIRLQDWARARRARGGAAIKVRLVKGANLPMEHVEASLHGWPLATWDTKQDTDTHYKRVLDYALRPDRTENVRIGVAGHNLFDIAYAWTLAGRRGVRDGVEFEMLLGMAEAQAEAVRGTVGGLLLYVPVVHPQDFDVAISYLVRRLEEGLERGEYDMIVTALPINSREIRAETLLREDIRLVMPVDHPLARKPRLTGEDLAGQQILTTEQGHLFSQLVEQACARLGAELLRDYQGTSLDALRVMVVMGMGLAFLPALYIASEIDDDTGLAVRDIEGEGIARILVLAWRGGSPARAFYRRLAADIRELTQEEVGDVVQVLSGD